MKRYRKYIPVLILLLVFVFLVFNLNDMEPWIYQFFNIHLGNVGSYDIPKLTEQFLVVAFLSCFISLVLGLSIGVFCLTDLGNEFLPVIDKLSMLMRSFPEIAMLRFVIPLLGLGVWPAVIALTVYGVLPIIYATISGVNNINADMLKAAKGMGMSKWQILKNIQIPLATPVIISALRVALISCIGGATLAVSTGAEGLGVLLGAGQNTYNVVLIMECAVLICLLSLATDKSLRLLERKFTFN